MSIPKELSPLRVEMDGVTALASGRAQCLKCGKTFSTKGNAYTHYRNLHMEQRPAQCTICMDVLKNPGVLTAHLRGKHGISLARLKKAPDSCRRVPRATVKASSGGGQIKEEARGGLLVRGARLLPQLATKKRVKVEKKEEENEDIKPVMQPIITIDD